MACADELLATETPKRPLWLYVTEPLARVGCGIASGMGVGVPLGVGAGPGIGVSTRASVGRGSTTTCGLFATATATVTVAALVLVATGWDDVAVVGGEETLTSVGVAVVGE